MQKKKPLIFKEVTNRKLKVSAKAKRESFYRLGIISTSFAEMEQQLQNLLVNFMGFETPIGAHYVEFNSLKFNTDLLQNINRWLKDEELAKIISLINSTRPHRNHLIHGTWEVEQKIDHSILITVTSGKPHYFKGEQGRVADVWSRSTSYQYTTVELDELTNSILHIVTQLKERLEYYKINKHYI